MSLDKTGSVKSEGRLRVTLQKEYELHFLDFFVDHVDTKREIRIGPTMADGLLNYIPYRPSVHVCPLCKLPGLKQEEAVSLKAIILKQFGRRRFRCNHCGFKDTIKLSKWEWETIITILAVLCVIIIAVVHWLYEGH